MKKLALIAVAAMMTSVSASPTAARSTNEPAYNHIPANCKAYEAEGAFTATTRAECISLLTSQFHFYYDDGREANAFAVHACDYYADEAPDMFNALWSSKQQCVDEVLN